MSLDKESWVQRRALFLQMLGPDEYPFGFYRHYAEQEWEERYSEEAAPQDTAKD